MTVPLRKAVTSHEGLIRDLRIGGQESASRTKTDVRNTKAYIASMSNT